ncbi:DNA gyrase inhibitor YacG [Caldimonas brevitalea]|nr:DNA gyrase inhibitor YacG [Caldimonas brevitalea]
MDPQKPAPVRRTVTCPNCKGESVYGPENPYRPFCSARCKNIDFGAWASESYRVEDSTPRQDGLDDENGSGAAR